MTDAESPHRYREMVEGFKFGHLNVPAGARCCGKPHGCTNPSDGCVYKGTPVKPLPPDSQPSAA